MAAKTDIKALRKAVADTYEAYAQAASKLDEATGVEDPEAEEGDDA